MDRAREAAIAAAEIFRFLAASAAHVGFLPIRHREADVVDGRLRRPAALVEGAGARDDERAALAGLRAKFQVGALAVVLAPRAPQAEHRGVEVACLGIVRARVGDVVDADGLEARGRLRLGGTAHRVDGGGERDGFAEFAAAHLAALEVFDEIADEFFHAVTLPWIDIPRITGDRRRR
jgi:hypothetical protein